MNNLGPFGLLAVAVGVAVLFVFVGAIPIFVARNLITRRLAATHLKEWLIYVGGAGLLILAFLGFFLYAKNKGVDDYTVVKWLNISITTAFVFGVAVKSFWPLRTKWTFWVSLCILVAGHFALLSRLHWQQAGYFWLSLVIGIPELALVIIVLGITFDRNGKLTKPESW
jgi:hypothetical protein